MIDYFLIRKMRKKKKEKLQPTEDTELDLLMSKWTHQNKDGWLSCSGMLKDPFNAVLLINKTINLVRPNVPALCNHTQFDCNHQTLTCDGMRWQQKTNWKVCVINILHRDVRALKMPESEHSFLMLTQRVWAGGKVVGEPLQNQRRHKEELKGAFGISFMVLCRCSKLNIMVTLLLESER